MGQGECLPPNIYEKVLFGETKTRLNNQTVLILRGKKLLERLPIIDKLQTRQSTCSLEEEEKVGQNSRIG